jgi:hypothetical protein
MNCPNCGAGANDNGVYKGKDIVHCLECDLDYNCRTEEVIIYRATSLEAGSRRREKFNEIHNLRKS